MADRISCVFNLVYPETYIKVMTRTKKKKKENLLGGLNVDMEGNTYVI